MALLTSQTREWHNGNNVSCAPLRATLLRRDTQELVVVCAKRKKTNYLTKNKCYVFIHWCPFCMGSNWGWRSQVGIWSSVSFVNWLSSTLRLWEQDLANPTPLDTANHWKPGHEVRGNFGMQRCPHIGIAAQQHVDMLLVVWVSSLHLCPVQEWFWHEALVTSLRLFYH